MEIEAMHTPCVPKRTRNTYRGSAMMTDPRVDSKLYQQCNESRSLMLTSMQLDKHQHLSSRYYPRLAASACCASSCRTAKNSFGWPMNSPSAVKAFAAPIAAPCVSVGRMIETGGNLRLRKMVGSGMIRLVWKSCPPNGGALRSGNTNPFVGSVKGGALPALSCQV